MRHTFNLSLLYPLPYGRGRAYGQNASALAQALLGGWDVGGIVNARSGLPVNVLIVAPRHPLSRRVRATSSRTRRRIAWRSSTPRAAATRATCAVPIWSRAWIRSSRTAACVFLNPAAFATPAPGTFGNLERNSIHGPNFKQVDFFFAKHFSAGGTTELEFRGEVFNLFNTVNFANPVGTLPQAMPTAALTEANRVQPGQPYTAAAAGTFGRLTSTVGRTVGLGTPRQVQFALRFSF